MVCVFKWRLLILLCLSCRYISTTRSILPNAQSSPYFSTISGPGIGFTTHAGETPYIYAGVRYVLHVTAGYDAWNNNQVGIDPEFKLDAEFASKCLLVERKADRQNGTTIFEYTMATAGMYLLKITTQADEAVFAQNLSIRANPAAVTLHFKQPATITAGGCVNAVLLLAPMRAGH